MAAGRYDDAEKVVKEIGGRRVGMESEQYAGRLASHDGVLEQDAVYRAI